MKALQFYKIAALVLLVVNVLMFGFFLYKKPPPPRSMPNHLRATERFQFDDSQNTQFLKMADEHVEEVAQYSMEQKGLLKKYFSQLEGVQIQDSTSLLSEITEIEVEKIQSTFDHLNDVKMLLNEDQKSEFSKFMNQVMRNVLSGEQKRPEGKPRNRK